MYKSMLSLLRPHQWIKNVFIIFPLFFGQQLLDSSRWIPVVCAFFAFCFASSGVYCLNDIIDAESDRKHPVKKNRPIANGAVSSRTGCVLMIVCWLFALALGSIARIDCELQMIRSLVIIVTYIVLNVAYCIKFKQFGIVDLFIVAVGFVLRLCLGGVVTNIPLSQWIVMMTFLLALFIAVGKRRDDVVAYETEGIKHRSNIARYNLAFMNQMLGIVASITMVCYIMYTMSDEVVDRLGTHHLYLTSVFVLAGILRYLQLVLVDMKSGSPTKIVMKDKFIQLTIVGWMISFFFLLYVL